MVEAPHCCAYKFLLVLVGYVAQTGLHDLGQALEDEVEVLVLLGSDFAVEDLGDDEVECVEKLAVDDFGADSFGEGDEAGVNDLLRLVLGVGEVVVEFHYLLQHYQHVL